MSLHQKVRDLREDHDLTQKDIARMLGMSQTGYSKYETGSCDYSTGVLVRLAFFYGTSIDYLLGLTGEKDPHTISPEAEKIYGTYREKLEEMILRRQKEKEERKKASRKKAAKKPAAAKKAAALKKADASGKTDQN